MFRLKHRYPRISNYAYGSFMSQGPATAMGAALKALWTADDHGTANMTDDGAGLISSWKAQVSTLALTAATTARPTYSATSFNGVAGVTGDGVANALSAAATTGLVTGTTEGWIIALYSQPQAAAVRNLFGYGTAAGAGACRSMFAAGSGKFSITDLTTDTLSDTRTVFAGMHIGMARFVSGGGSIQGFLDTKPTSLSSISATFNTGSNICRIFGGVGASAGGFGNATVRYIAVTGALTALQLNQLTAWMCHSSGRLAPYLLPDNHPFRHLRP